MIGLLSYHYIFTFLPLVVKRGLKVELSIVDTMPYIFLKFL